MMLTTREDEDEDTDVLEVWFAGCHAGKAIVTSLSTCNYRP